MRVTTVEVTPVAVPLVAPRQNAISKHGHVERAVLRVETDEGVTGLGEVGNRVAFNRLAALTSMFRGLDPFNLEVARERLLGRGFWDRAAAIMLTGFEMACLDIQGKLLGRPVNHLLGGPVRSSVPMTAGIFRTTGEPPMHRTAHEIVEVADQLAEDLGVRTIKLKAGTVDWREDVDALEALRGAFPDTELRIDANAAWSVGTALRLLRATRDIDLEWVEDPVRGVAAMEEVRSRSTTPVATNMTVTTLEDLAAARRSADVVLIDLWFVGGLVRAQALARAVEAHGIEVAIHSAGGGTTELGIGQAANLHFAAALPQLAVAADGVHHDHADDIVVDDLTCVDGEIRVPDGPGLGVELDPGRLEKYAREWKELFG